ncbi:MAG: cytochrome c2-2 [Pseudomonadota bacterium]|jgi:cytochrome c
MRHLACLAALLLPALPALAQDQSAQIKLDAGRAFFDAECRRCHSTDADRSSYGPLLDGVLGRKAGTLPGYPYSAALAGAGFVWTSGALKAWMEANDALVPDTKMRHVGISDPTVQDFVVTYLESLKAPD